MAQQRYIIDARTTKVGIYKTGAYPDFADTPVVVFTKGTYRLSVNGEVITVSSEAGETVFPAFSLIDDIYEAGGASPITMPTTWAEWYALVEGWFSALAISGGSGLATQSTLEELLSESNNFFTQIGAQDDPIQTDSPSGEVSLFSLIKGIFQQLLSNYLPKTWFQLTSAATTNATVVRNTGGSIYAMSIFNRNTAGLYVKMKNANTTPVPGTTTPDYTLYVPGNTSIAGFIWNLPDGGVNFGTGITLWTTTDNAALSTNAVGAGDLSINILHR